MEKTELGPEGQVPVACCPWRVGSGSSRIRVGHHSRARSWPSGVGRSQRVRPRANCADNGFGPSALGNRPRTNCADNGFGPDVLGNRPRANCADNGFGPGALGNHQRCEIQLRSYCFRIGAGLVIRPDSIGNVACTGFFGIGAINFSGPGAPGGIGFFGVDDSGLWRLVYMVESDADIAASLPVGFPYALLRIWSDL